jgi:hypothetical protein
VGETPEASMPDQSLTIGAHLLLWVAPLALVLVVIFSDIVRPRLKGGDR